jgi:carbon storage regulator
MLVVSRAKNEQIRIGEDIIVRVISVSGGTVKLGIDAPSSVAVHRQEVFDTIKQANDEASKGVRALDDLF